MLACVPVAYVLTARAYCPCCWIAQLPANEPVTTSDVSGGSDVAVAAAAAAAALNAQQLQWTLRHLQRELRGQLTAAVATGTEVEKETEAAVEMEVQQDGQQVEQQEPGLSAGDDVLWEEEEQEAETEEETETEEIESGDEDEATTPILLVPPVRVFHGLGLRVIWAC